MGFDIPFIRPVFPSSEELAADVAKIVHSNWFTNFGPKEQQFRVGIADYLGGDLEVVTFTNATIALVASLSQLLESRAPGGLVIVPSFTFAAGPQAIRWAGHHPLFIDIDGESLQPSLQAAQAACDEHGPKIVGILLCNTFGIGGEAVRSWEELATRHGIPLIIDSAAGFGSMYPDGSRVGTRGDCEIFSFHATKPFAIGEGGAVVTRDGRIAEVLRSFSNFGFEGGDGAVRAGLNGKLQEINAAIGLRQLLTIDDVVRERRQVLERYARIFVAADAGSTVPFAENSSVCFAPVMLHDAASRNPLLDALRTAGIEARVYYAPPVHQHPTFADDLRVGRLEVTEAVSTRILCLPVFQGMPESTFQVVQALVEEHCGRKAIV